MEFYGLTVVIVLNERSSLSTSSTYIRNAIHLSCPGLPRGCSNTHTPKTVLSTTGWMRWANCHRVGLRSVLRIIERRNRLCKPSRVRSPSESQIPARCHTL